MNYYGRAEQTVNSIIERFRAGEIAAPLAQVFIQKEGIPMADWSYLNRLACIIGGCTDARGFKQWHAVGRKVSKGQKARAYILIPLISKKQDEAGEEDKRLYGFKGQAVFDLAQTEGEPLPDAQTSHQFLEERPFIEVARRWELQVTTYSGASESANARYFRGRAIELGVENVATWLHELLHAADDRLGNLKEKGQHWRSETVAELGAATLAMMMGWEVEANLGGCWEYVSAYAKAAEIKPETACIRAIERICQAIDLILSEAEQVKTAVVAEA